MEIVTAAIVRANAITIIVVTIIEATVVVSIN
jgi:hypothetical protein